MITSRSSFNISSNTFVNNHAARGGVIGAIFDSLLILMSATVLLLRTVQLMMVVS